MLVYEYGAEPSNVILALVGVIADKFNESARLVPTTSIWSPGDPGEPPPSKLIGVFTTP